MSEQDTFFSQSLSIQEKRSVRDLIEVKTRSVYSRTHHLCLGNKFLLTSIKYFNSKTASTENYCMRSEISETPQIELSDPMSSKEISDDTHKTTRYKLLESSDWLFIRNYRSMFSFSKEREKNTVVEKYCQVGKLRC